MELMATRRRRSIHKWYGGITQFIQDHGAAAERPSKNYPYQVSRGIHVSIIIRAEVIELALVSVGRGEVGEVLRRDGLTSMVNSRTSIRKVTT